jgi:hypothetical protein
MGFYFLYSGLFFFFFFFFFINFVITAFGTGTGPWAMDGGPGGMTPMMTTPSILILPAGRYNSNSPLSVSQTASFSLI